MSEDALAETAKAHALRAAAAAWLLCTVVLAVVMMTPWGLGFILPNSARLAIPLAMVISAAAQFFLPLEAIGDGIVEELRSKPAEGRLKNVAEEMAIATGNKMGRVVIYDSKIPNVGALPSNDGTVVMATVGAVKLLNRAELQSLVAAQFAGMDDEWCRVATRAEYAWGFARVIGFCSFFFSPFGWAVALASIFIPRFVEATRDLCADVAAVATARNPAALASGLRALRPAAKVAHKLKLGSLFVPASPFLVLPIRVQATTSSNERKWTSADEIATELALRADRAEALATGADPSKLTGREFRKRWAELGTIEAFTADEHQESDALAQAHEAHETSEVTEARQAQAATHPPQTQPAPGWYNDPQQVGYVRWWNGERWTEDRNQLRSG